MKILVTGGAGFIGSHLVDQLIFNRHQVYIVDNLSTGKKENLNKKAEFLKTDVQNPNLRKVFEDCKFDIVFHLAAQVDVSESAKNPKKDALANIFGTLNVLDLAAKNKVKKIILAHSVACFGEPQYLPIDERHPIGPISFYGLSKYTAATYAQLYSQNYNLPYVINIFANVYGPRQNPLGEGGVVAVFTYKMLKGIAPEIFGNGKQTRDFIFVEDVVDAILSSTKLENEILTIGTEKETSINDLYKKLASLLNFEKKPIYKPKKEGDIFRSVLSIKKAKKLLGFTPKTPLDIGLGKTINYFKKEFLS